MRTNLFINNQEIVTNEYVDIHDPGCVSNVVGTIAKGTPEHVDQAVQAAQQAYLSWRNTTLDERIECLLKSAQRIEEISSTLAEIVSKENGMLLDTTKEEINLAISAITNITDIAKDFFEKNVHEDDTGWVSVEKRPMGVIAGIIPWNAPIALTMQKLAPVLVTGNTIVFKPSPFAPSGVAYVLRSIAEFFPPGVINVVLGDGDVGQLLTTHPLVRKIAFTGGGNTAKQVMKAAAESIKNIQLELGGNDPAIILDDVNIDQIMPKIVRGVFRRSGQYCFAIKRIYIPDKLYDQFLNSLVRHTEQLSIGHQLDKRADIGPLNNQAQYQYVQSLIRSTRENGAELITLGQKLDPDNWENGYYIQPVIVSKAKPDAQIVSCEQFGPIIPLITYSDENEAIRMANHTEYGLGSSVWSVDFERALNVGRQIEAGVTFINGVGQSKLGYKYIPFGGVKQSGIGRVNSDAALHEYTEYYGINYHK